MCLCAWNTKMMANVFSWKPKQDGKKKKKSKKKRSSTKNKSKTTKEDQNKLNADNDQLVSDVEKLNVEAWWFTCKIGWTRSEICCSLFFRYHSHCDIFTYSGPFWKLAIYRLVNIESTRNYVAHINEPIIWLVSNVQNLRCDNWKLKI